jgi:hypothetical protein
MSPITIYRIIFNSKHNTLWHGPSCKKLSSILNTVIFREIPLPKQQKKRMMFMSKGYWKLIDEADGWDTHHNTYVWMEEVDETDRYGNPTGRKTYQETNDYSRSRPSWQNGSSWEKNSPWSRW